MIELYDGRPVNTSGRAKKKQLFMICSTHSELNISVPITKLLIRWRRAQKSTDCLRLRSYVKTCFSAIRRKQDFTCL